MPLLSSHQTLPIRVTEVDYFGCGSFDYYYHEPCVCSPSPILLSSPEQHDWCAHSVDTRLAVYLVRVAARSHPLCLGSRRKATIDHSLLCIHHNQLAFPLQPSLYHLKHQPCYSLACGRVFALAPSDAAPQRAVRTASSARRPLHRDALRLSLSYREKSVCCPAGQQPPLLPLPLSSRSLSSCCSSTTLRSRRPQGATDPRTTLATLD